MNFNIFGENYVVDNLKLEHTKLYFFCCAKGDRVYKHWEDNFLVHRFLIFFCSVVVGENLLFTIV